MRMRTATSGRAVALTIGALAGSAAVAGAQSPSPTPTPTPAPAVQPASVTLVTTPSDVTFAGAHTERVTLAGQLRSIAAVAAVRVRLTGRVAAYGRTTVTRTASTDAAGQYAFSVRPAVNTTYRVDIEPGQAVEGASPRRKVRLFPALGLANRTLKRGLQLGMVARGPGRIRFAHGSRAVQRGTARRGVFYLRLRGERSYRRVGSARLSAVRCRTTCVRTAKLAVHRLRLLRRTKDVGVCAQGTVFRALGRATACGAPRMGF